MLRKPNTCYGCRALSHRCASWYCCLGYEVLEREERRIWGKVYVPFPLESCPKPRTLREYFNADHKDRIAARDATRK